MKGEAYIKYCEQLLFNELARQFAISCTAINKKSKLRVAALGYEEAAPLVNVVLGNYDCSSLEYFGAVNQPAVYPSRPLEEFHPADYDCAFVFAQDLGAEAELWNRVQSLREEQLRSAASSNQHCSFLRFSLAQQVLRGVFFSLELNSFFTCLDIHKLLVLSLAVLQTPEHGLMVECGSYKGGSAVFIGQHLKLIRQHQQLHAFDTFAGIPAAGAEDGGTPWTSGQFVDTSLESVQGFIDSNALQQLVTLHPGLITENVPNFLASQPPASLVFLDTDQYLSTKRCAEAALLRLARNGIILIDDAADTGVARAIAEIRQEQPKVKGYHPIKSMYVMYLDTDANFNCSRYLDSAQAPSMDAQISYPV